MKGINQICLTIGKIRAFIVCNLSAPSPDIEFRNCPLRPYSLFAQNHFLQNSHFQSFLTTLSVSLNLNKQIKSEINNFLNNILNTTDILYITTLL